MTELSDFKKTVAERVASINPTVLERVVEHYAEKEADRRVPLILDGFRIEDELNKSLGKFKPELMFDESGQTVNTYWTQGTLEARNKVEEQTKRVREALSKAIDGEYELLEKFVKSRNQPKKEETRD